LRKQDWEERLKGLKKQDWEDCEERLKRLRKQDWEDKIDRIEKKDWWDWEKPVNNNNNGHTIVNTMVTQLFSNCITNADNCMTMYDYWMTVSFFEQWTVGSERRTINFLNFFKQ